MHQSAIAAGYVFIVTKSSDTVVIVISDRIAGIGKGAVAPGFLDPLWCVHRFQRVRDKGMAHRGANTPGQHLCIAGLLADELCVSQASSS